MNTVRYFGRDVDPASYRRGFGVLGYCVYLLNKPRALLESLIIEGILVLESREADDGIPASFTVEQAKVRPARAKMGFEQATTYETRQERTEGRYWRLRPNSDEPGTRPVPVEQGLVRYLMENTSNRSARYASAGYFSIDEGVFTNTETESNNV